MRVWRSCERGDRSGERKRRRDLLNGLREDYRAGRYVVGSHSREVECDGCGRVFPVWRDQKMRFCSRPCAGIPDRPPAESKEHRRRRRYERKAAKRRSLAAIRALERGPKEPKTLPAKRECLCQMCGEAFTPTYGDKRRSYCSAKCGKRHNRRAYGTNHRRRARRYGVSYEPVNRLKVFRRDRWRCQVCGVKTPQRLLGTFDQGAPELDHRIPMAPPHRGPHSYANCQLACRACNIRKGATLVLGQQPLFACE